MQRIRNQIAHGDGQMRDHQGDLKDGIVRDIEEVGFANIAEDEVVLLEGFLSTVLDACIVYFKLIAAAVDAKEIPH